MCTTVALAEVYAADSARRPLAMVRDAAYWPTHIASCVSGDTGQLRPPGAFFAAAMSTAASEVVGYALVHWWHRHPDSTCYIDVTELCTRTTEQNVEGALLAEICRGAAFWSMDVL